MATSLSPLPPSHQSILPAKAGQKRKRATSAAALDHILPTPQPQHPYLSGNFAPIYQTLPLTPCTYIGQIPQELAGGEYVRNGSNPVTNGDLGRDAHWFDGDGMLSGVSFREHSETGEIIPEFVNAFVQTDLYRSAITSPRLKTPILPSIATLVNPLASFIRITLAIFRTLLLVLLSNLPGSRQAIKKISVANTNVVYHDGRALATCESGPPMRIQLPGLETVGWYDGTSAEGEPEKERQAASAATDGKVLGGDSGGLLGFMREWTTAHPRVDPATNEMIMFHSCFAPPYVQYSVVPPAGPTSSSNIDSEKSAYSTLLPSKRIINAAVPGVKSAKMMHDFGVSALHTIIMDLPLSLDPTNQLRGAPPVSYDPSQPARFGVFPRHSPQSVKWFETDAACIFHTANSWDVRQAQWERRETQQRRRQLRLTEQGQERTMDEWSLSDNNSTVSGEVVEVNMLACRLTSATLVFAAGNIAPPVVKRNTRIATVAKRKRMPFFSKYDDTIEEVVVDEQHDKIRMDDESTAPLLHRSSSLPELEATTSLVPYSSSGTSAEDEGEECRLYLYSFSLSTGQITQQYALTALPFEFPAVAPKKAMHPARFVYGCSTTTAASFSAALGKATKIDALVKIDARSLVRRGRANPPRGVTGCVDTRSMREVLQSQKEAEAGTQTAEKEPISVFTMPDGWFAQEMRFVPSQNPSSRSYQMESNDDDYEDDGYLLFYAFDESQLLPSGDVPSDTAPAAHDASFPPLPSAAASPDLLSSPAATSPHRAHSELWVLSARDMKTLIARVRLPQRVPYGLHGAWFGKEEVDGQRGVESFRVAIDDARHADDEKSWMGEAWSMVRASVEEMLG
jgi:carotenoid cleavage dioxygenase-like enzyme